MPATKKRLKEITKEGEKAYVPFSEPNYHHTYLSEDESSAFLQGWFRKEFRRGVEAMMPFDRELNALCKKHDVFISCDEDFPGFFKVMREGEKEEILGPYGKNFPVEE